MRTKLIISTFIACWLSTGSMQAQLSTNPDKFLGNITTGYQVDAGGGVPNFYELWNQITCENESKWGSVEGTRDKFKWDCDNAFNYAKQHNFPYKFHALVWGSQYPSWIESLSYADRHDAIVEWYNAVKKKYAKLPMIDVVNEAVDGHQQGTHFIKEALGGGGKTGYDWLIRAFDMAGQRWPDAILIYNDFNSFRWDVDKYITLVQTLRDAGAPIDAYGNQAHDLGGCSANELTNVMQKQQNALKMPMYVTEYDIGDYDPETHGNSQKTDFKAQIPIMWEAPYCAGVTLWGYVYGRTWINLKEKNNPYKDARDANGNLIGPGISGLYINGEERPAMTWLKEYMASDAAKNAKSPFPSMKKEASIYIRPSALKVLKDEQMKIKIHAKLATKTIEKVDFYVNDSLVKTMTEAPYIVEYTPIKTGWNNTKAVVTATDGSTYERYGRISVTSSKNKHEPYSETIPELPGTINITEWDKGASGIHYSNASRDLVSMKDKQWMEYTVDVKEDGLYSFDATVASSNANGIFHFAEYGLDSLSFLTNFVAVPNTGGTSEWKTLHGNLLTKLTAGRHVFTMLVDKGSFYIKDITFSQYKEADGMSIRMKSYTTEYGVGDHITLEAKISSKNSPISKVQAYANNMLIGTMTATSTGSSTTTYQCDFVPTATGTYSITIVATAEDGSTKESAPREVKVTSSTPTAIQTVKNSHVDDTSVYNLMGVKVGTKAEWQSLPHGLYIVNGRKVTK